MTVKAELEKNEEKGIINLSFRCSTPEEHETLDAIRTAVFGEHVKRGTYMDSNHLLIQIKVE